VGEGL
jgi:hypothetical protein